ncbi:MAG: tRNA lysidine(34) synthetase TilS [Pseudomonadota bacterium]
MAPVLERLPDGPICVAVSGGGDSIALLVLLAAWAGPERLTAITVDHRLRPGFAAEAEAAARAAAALSVPHHVLDWSGWDGQGNLQDAARRARRDLLTQAARAAGAATVALGHTADDQAETLLMRLARGSGVYGLEAMAPVSTRGGLIRARPILGIDREPLRVFLRGRGIAWAEDPSNADPAFERVRMRETLPMLAKLGLTVPRLAGTAAALARAGDVVRAEVERLARRAARPHPAGWVALDRAAFDDALPELRLRLLAETLRWVAAADYTPRLEALEALAGHLRTETGNHTLHGCLIRAEARAIHVFREPARCGPPVPAGAVWDRRWDTGADRPGLTVSALGPELSRVPTPVDAALRRALSSTPAFRDADGALIAAPFAMPVKGCHAALWTGTEGYFSRLTLR